MPVLKLNTDQQIWVTSDTHAYHKNIVFGQSRWDNKSFTRPFNTVDEMNNTLIKSINYHVKENDILFHLGDVAFDGIDRINEFMREIKCKTIHLLLGNHDHHVDNDRQTSKGVYVKSLFTTINSYLELHLGKRKICLMHYPISNWNDRPQKSIMLHGHTHGHINEPPNSFDVGIDVAYKYFDEYRPFKLEEVLEIIKTSDIDIWGQ